MENNELVRVVFNDWYIKGSVDEEDYSRYTRLTNPNKVLAPGRGFIVSVPEGYIQSKIPHDEYKKLEKHFGTLEYEQMFNKGLLEDKIIVLGEGWIHPKTAAYGVKYLPQVYLTKEYISISNDKILLLRTVVEHLFVN